MKRIFITHIAPKNKILEYKVSPAACNFSYNLISGGGFNMVYSILPANVSGKKDFCNNQGVEYIYHPFRKIRILKKLAPIAENFSLFFKIERDSSVWLYNMTMLNIWLVFLLRIFKPTVLLNIIVLDFTPGDKFYKFFLKQINKCDGRILLANYPFFKKENSAILPGVVPNNKSFIPTITEIKKEFLISGVLSENISMLSMLLDSFSKMPECTLHITGTIEDKSKIERYCNKYKNIIYYGCVPYEKYIDILQYTPFILSTRNPQYPENQCNFPSKIIEALLHNRIIISTLHYEQLNGISYLEVPANEEGFTKAIKNITELDSNDLLCYANQSELVKERFSTNIWFDTMKRIEADN